jgi:phospholipase/carboxylesterase
MSQSIDLSTLPQRRGDAPETNPRMPHQQISQNAPAELQEALFERAGALTGVVVGRSHVSVPGARAFHLDDAHASGSQDAFMVDTEFAHLHPQYDGSLHLVLPEALARQVIERGWGEFHPLVLQGLMPPTSVMVYGPRDADELEVVWSIVKAAYANASGGTGATEGGGATQPAGAEHDQ